MALKERGYAPPNNEWQLKKGKRPQNILQSAAILGAAAGPPVIPINLPLLTLSNSSAPGDPYVIYDNVAASVTTDDTDGNVTTGVDLYCNGTLIGHMDRGSTAGTWILTDYAIPLGSRDYFARRLYIGGILADGVTTTISALDASTANMVFLFDATTGTTLDTSTSAAGTSPPAVTLGGTRTFNLDVRVEVNDTSGGTALGQAKFRYGYADPTGAIVYIESGRTTTASYAAIGALAGLTINFAAGPYNANNTYRSRVASVTDSNGKLWSQATTTKMPLCHSGANTGGQFALFFDGTDDFLACTDSSAFGFMSGAGKSHEYEVYIQGRQLATGANRFFLAFQNSASDTAFWSWGAVSTGGWFAGCNDGAGKNVTSATADDTEQHLHNWRSSGTAATENRDQLAADPSASAQNPGTITLNQASVGVNARLTQNGFLNGYVSKIAMFSVQHSATQRRAWSNKLNFSPYVQTIKNSGATVTMTSDRAHAAGITSVKIGATEVCSAADHGRGFQVSCNLDRDLYGAGGYNPTEQGSNLDGTGSTSTSVSVSRYLSSDQSVLRVVTRPAYWHEVGEGVTADAPQGAINGEQPATGWQFERVVIANWLGNANIFRWEFTLTVPANFVQKNGIPDFRLLVSESIAVYLQRSNFLVNEDYHSDGSLTAIAAGDMLTSGPVFRTSPPVISKGDNTLAVGIYSLTHSDGASRAFLSRAGDYRVTDYGAGLNIINPDCQVPQYYGAGRVPAGKYRYVTHLVIGTKAQVQTGMDLLRTTYGYPT